MFLINLIALSPYGPDYFGRRRHLLYLAAQIEHVYHDRVARAGKKAFLPYRFVQLRRGHGTAAVSEQVFKYGVFRVGKCHVTACVLYAVRGEVDLQIVYRERGDGLAEVFLIEALYFRVLV